MSVLAHPLALHPVRLVLRLAARMTAHKPLCVPLPPSDPNWQGGAVSPGPTGSEGVQPMAQPRHLTTCTHHAQQMLGSPVSTPRWLLGEEWALVKQQLKCRRTGGLFSTGARPGRQVGSHVSYPDLAHSPHMGSHTSFYHRATTLPSTSKGSRRPALLEGAHLREVARVPPRNLWPSHCTQTGDLFAQPGTRHRASGRRCGAGGSCGPLSWLKAAASPDALWETCPWQMQAPQPHLPEAY